MKTMKVSLSLFKKIPWRGYAAVGVLVVVGLVFGAWRALNSPKSEDQPTYQTAAVRRGDLQLSATGTGVLVAGTTVELNFSVDGTVGTIDVQVGDEVKSGQVLATLSDEDIEELTVNLDNEQLALNADQKTLDDLLNKGDVSLTQALADLSEAQSAYDEAVKNHRQKGDGRCDPALTQEYYFEYLYAQHRVDEWEMYLEDGNTGYGTDFIITKLAPMREERNQAYNNWSYCQGYTEDEILESDANLEVAKANLSQANENYQYLLMNSGVDPEAVEIARAQVKNDDLQVTRAQDELDGATLVAPMDGTIISISADEGETIETDTVFITIADLNNPSLQVSVDEADLQSFTVGCSADIVFDAIKDRVFDGVVTQVSPTLVTFPFGDMSVVEGLVELQNANMTPGETLRLNLRGTVYLTCDSAQNALLVPVSAIVNNGGAYLYVLTSDGTPEKRQVEVGARGTEYAEILSGVEENELVITNPAGLK